MTRFEVILTNVDFFSVMFLQEHLLLFIQVLL